MGYGKSVYTFNGGEMAYNTAVGAAGAIWPGNYSEFTISGDFQLHDNKAGNLGGAIRFTEYSSLTMTGGWVYNNTVNGENSAFYLNNNTCILKGGTIDDNFSYAGGLGLQISNATINGVIDLQLATTHNTVYLLQNFTTVQFITNESATNFSQFNFAPYTGYEYVEGDETKLVCMNEGYETYWDATTNAFRLQAVVTE